MKLEPVAWILRFSDPDPQTDFHDGPDCPAAWIGRAVPLFDAIPAGYVLVKAEPDEDAYVCVGCKAIYWDDNVSCDCEVPSLNKFDRVKVIPATMIEGEQ